MPEVQFYRDPDLPFFELKLCAGSDIAYKKHTHEEYSLAFIDSGRTLLWHAGKLSEVGAGSSVFISPGLVHSCNPLSIADWHYRMLYIEAAWMRGFFRGRAAGGFRRPVVRDVAAGGLEYLLASLRGPASPLEKEANLCAIIERAVGGAKPAAASGNCREPAGLSRACDYLHAHFAEKITLDQLARVAGLSRFRLLRSFKDTYTIPPHTYQTLLRVNHAKKRLRAGIDIAEVALAAGFYDQSHFSKVFKSHTGVSPEKYRQILFS